MSASRSMPHPFAELIGLTFEPYKLTSGTVPSRARTCTRTLDRVPNSVWWRPCSLLHHLTAPSRHRAKRKAPSSFAKCPTSLVAGAGFEPTTFGL